MNRTATLLMAAVLVVGGVSAFPMAAAAQSGPSVASAIGGSAHAQIDENASENATDVAPGERLTAVVGVGQAEFEGEMELRSYGVEYALAASNDSKADVVGERLATIEQRLVELEQERDELEAARENGSIGEGEYRARVTELSARTETVEQLADASEARAGELPADLLESKGINVTAIQTLGQNAENLTGPEVAAIARSIAGDDVGGAISRGPPEDIGGPVDGVPSPDERGADADAGDAQAAVDHAARQVDAAEARLEQAEQRVGENASENATEALEQARAELESARTALEDARTALDAGDGDEASAAADAASDHAELAESHAQDAIEAAQQAGPDDGRDDGSDAGASDGSSGGAGSDY